ncbi:MAG: activator of HSP90 ATPase [Flavobacteriaceae bacterium]|jgi:activator of HSP90 ATPase
MELVENTCALKVNHSILTIISMKESVKSSIIIKVKPGALYNAWLDTEEHSNMTGGDAKCSDQVGESHAAWDGYISGKNLELIPNEKIVQSWRTFEFATDDEDSRLEIQLKEIPEGTELTLIHTNIPEGQTQYENGWVENYFNPMLAYFNS